MKGKKIFFISILMWCCGQSAAQTFTKQGCYWPLFAPDRSQRPSADATAEDWWYDLKALPAAHPAYASDRYIACGYSFFDDPGLGNIYTNEPGLKWQEIDPQEPLSQDDICNFNLPDMRNLNQTGTIGLIKLGSSPANPHVWIYNYGRETTFLRVIPTADGGFLAAGYTLQIKTVGPQPTDPAKVEVQYTAPANNYYNRAIEYKSPPLTPGGPLQSHTFNINLTNIPIDPNEANGGGFDAFFKTNKRGHACLLKVDAEGRVLWYYQYGETAFNTANGGLEAYYNGSLATDIIEVAGGYILSGHLQNYALYGDYALHGFLAKVNYDGDVLWMRSYKEGGDYVRSRITRVIANDNGSALYVTGERTKMKSNNLYGFCGQFPKSTYCINGTLAYQESESHGSILFEPFVKKISMTTQDITWDLPLNVDNTMNHKVRDIALDVNKRLLVPVLAQCELSFANGECKKALVKRIVDNNGPVVDQTIDFGVVRAYDLSNGLAIAATTDGGFVVSGIKKTHDLKMHKNWAASPYGNGYNLSNCGGFSPYTQTDAFVAKCNSAGQLEWNTIFDNRAPSPGGGPYTTAGNPLSQGNIDNWMNVGDNRSKKDIKRQECLFAITTSPDGGIVVAGTMSSNIDDSYVAMVENTCVLDLSHHLVTRIPGLSPALQNSNMDNFVSKTINTGKTPDLVVQNLLGEFTVADNAQVTLTAGSEITMYEYTDLEPGTDVVASINPALPSCTPGTQIHEKYYPISPPPGGRTAAGGSKSASDLITEPVSRIGIYPNPVKQKFTLNVNLPKQGTIQVELFDLAGHRIKTLAALTVAEGNFSRVFDIADLAAGVYLLSVSGDNFSRKIKLFKQ